MRLARTIARLREYHCLLRNATFVGAHMTITCPEFEVKALLGRQMWWDATFTDRIANRVRELGGELTELDEPASDLIVVAMEGGASSRRLAALSEAKARLLLTIRLHVKELDPVLDEPTLVILRVLAASLTRQESELRTAWAELAVRLPDAIAARLDVLRGEVGASTVGEARRPIALTVPDQPARDPHLRSGAALGGSVKSLSSPEVRSDLIATLHTMLTDVEIGNVELQPFDPRVAANAMGLRRRYGPAVLGRGPPRPRILAPNRGAGRSLRQSSDLVLSLEDG